MDGRSIYDLELFTAPEGTLVGTVACSVVWVLLGALVGWIYYARLHAQAEGVGTESIHLVQTPPAASGNRVTRSAAAAEKLKQRTDTTPQSPHPPSQNSSPPSAVEGNEDEEWTDDSDSDSESSGDEDLEALRLKMVIVIHKSPEFTPQLAAVASASAALGVVEKTWKENAAQGQPGLSDERNTHNNIDDSVSTRNWKWYLWWNQVGVAKVTLKCNSEAELAAIAETATDAKLPLFAYGKSVLAIGPAPSDVLQPITGALKLFN